MTAKRNKKGPTKGSGGEGKRALEGRKATPPAKDRHWYAGKQRAKAAKRAAAPAEGKPAAPRGEPTSRDRSGPDVLVGRNPVVEALRVGVPGTRLFLANSLDSDDRITEAARLAGEAGIEIQEVPRTELDRRCASAGQPDAAHQGLVLRVRPYRYATAEDLLDAAQRAQAPPLIVALDGITDPHNLGAVVRSGAAFGAHGVLIPERRSAGVTTAAWKTSAGALARLPVARATNLARALEGYKRAGLFVAGLDTAGDTRLDELHLAPDPLVLVIGAEGTGLSRIVRRTCDTVASIPITGTESLNASVAAGVSLYEVARRRTSGR